MLLDVKRQEDGSFRVVACSYTALERCTIGVIYRIDDAEALFRWKERSQLPHRKQWGFRRKEDDPWPWTFTFSRTLDETSSP